MRGNDKMEYEKIQESPLKFKGYGKSEDGRHIIKVRTEKGEGGDFYITKREKGKVWFKDYYNYFLNLEDKKIYAILY